MRKRKVTNTVLGFIGILFIAALLLVPATQARAETVKYNYTTQITKVEWFPVPDEKGHIVGLYERRGVAIFETKLRPLRIGVRLTRSKGKFRFRGIPK